MLMTEVMMMMLMMMMMMMMMMMKMMMMMMMMMIDDRIDGDEKGPSWACEVSTLVSLPEYE